MPKRDRVAEQRQKLARRDSDLCPNGHGSIPADCRTQGCTCNCPQCRSRKQQGGATPRTAPAPAGKPDAPPVKPERPPLGRFPAWTAFEHLVFDGEVWDARLVVNKPGSKALVIEEKHQSVHELLRLLWKAWYRWTGEHPEWQKTQSGGS